MADLDGKYRTVSELRALASEAGREAAASGEQHRYFVVNAGWKTISQ